MLRNNLKQLPPGGSACSGIISSNWPQRGSVCSGITDNILKGVNICRNGSLRVAIKSKIPLDQIAGNGVSMLRCMQGVSMLRNNLKQLAPGGSVCSGIISSTWL